MKRSYFVLGSPLKHDDASEHIGDAPAEQREASEIVNLLVSLGVVLDVAWGSVCEQDDQSPAGWNPGAGSISDLRTIQRGVSDLAAAMGGADRFRANLGQVKLKPGGRNLGAAHSVELAPGGFDLWGVVHELGHAWDAVSWLGWRMQRQLGCSLLNYGLKLFHGAWGYDLGNGPPPAGVDAQFDPFEDFAETVTAYVYPGVAAERTAAKGYPYDDPNRGYTYGDYYATPRGRFIQGFVNPDYGHDPRPYVDRVP